MYGWNDRPTKAEIKYSVGDGDGGTTATVYKIGEYLVTVPKNGDDLTYKSEYRHTTDPRHTLPNMDIANGEIRIPVSDLVGEVLKRLEPVDLARELWQDDDVKAHFIDMFVQRYESGFSDEDRRNFLFKVREEVHNKRLDDLAKTMHSIEYDLSKRSFFYHEVNSVNDWLREKGYEVRLKHHDDDPNYRISGKNYNEAREFWREQVIKQFQGPEQPPEAQ